MSVSLIVLLSCQLCESCLNLISLIYTVILHSPFTINIKSVIIHPYMHLPHIQIQYAVVASLKTALASPGQSITEHMHTNVIVHSRQFTDSNSPQGIFFNPSRHEENMQTPGRLRKHTDTEHTAHTHYFLHQVKIAADHTKYQITKTFSKGKIAGLTMVCQQPLPEHAGMKECEEGGEGHSKGH